MLAVLVSTYELGHQPFGLASPAAWLRRDGIDVQLVDAARERLTEEAIRQAGLVAFHLPMHTATRLAGPLIRRARAVNPAARICAYGLYAPLNAEWLQSLGVDDVLGGEFEEQLAGIARETAGRAAMAGGGAIAEGGTIAERGAIVDAPPAPEGAGFAAGALPRIRFLVPDRRGLPPLSRYATLRLADGTEQIVGYTEASRGCRHGCRHCPIVPVYDGQFRIVQREVVLADVAGQVAAGARHMTFGDPDFFNGPTHAMRLVDALHAAHPEVTYDVTIKVEHLLAHRDLLPRLRETGCLFVTTAVESLDDRVLALLEKGHTRQDFLDVVAACRRAGLTLVPTFVAFHPWVSLEGYCELLDTIAELDLIDHVAPIQLAIRLLIPQGSRLLDLSSLDEFIGSFDPRTLTYQWRHGDARVDALQQEIAAIVGNRLTSERRPVFEDIWRLARERAGLPPPSPSPATGGAQVPYLSEPWYCCAEPNPEQLTLV
jgi:radical SAM superfamily enzyme YgiQ (UPF0313 family)